MRAINLCLIVLLTVMTGQVAHTLPDPPDEVKEIMGWATLPFTDGFEDALSMEDLVDADRWSGSRLEPSASSAELTTDVVQAGGQAVRFSAPPGASPEAPMDPIAGATLHKDGIYIFQSETLEVSAWFYLDETVDLGGITVLDFTCDVTCAGAGMGPRVRIDAEGRPSVHLGQPGLPTLTQDQHSVQSGEWFHLRFSVLLGGSLMGSTQLYLNGRRIIDVRQETNSWLPAIDNVAIGLTSNNSSSQASVVVDEVIVRAVWS